MSDFDAYTPEGWTFSTYEIRCGGVAVEAGYYVQRLGVEIARLRLLPEDSRTCRGQHNARLICEAPRMHRLLMEVANRQGKPVPKPLLDEIQASLAAVVDPELCGILFPRKKPAP